MAQLAAAAIRARRDIVCVIATVSLSLSVLSYPAALYHRMYAATNARNSEWVVSLCRYCRKPLSMQDVHNYGACHI